MTDPSGHSMTDDKCGYQGQDCKGRYDKRDLTAWVIQAAEYTANYDEIEEIENLNKMTTESIGGVNSTNRSLTFQLFAAKKFYSLVHDGAIFDFKDKISITLGQSILIDGDWYEFSTAGNILFGYYGRAAGFSTQSLHAGAGVAQVIDFTKNFSGMSNGLQDDGARLGPISNFFDTPDDYAAVEMGAILYDQAGPLTYDVFSRVLQEYKNEMALVTDPGNFQEANVIYQADYFLNR